MGAFVGGLYAREGDLISSAGRTKQFSGRMGNLWRMLTDVTYPIVAYTTVFRNIQLEAYSKFFVQGHEFNRSIFKVRTMCTVFLRFVSKHTYRRSMTSILKICGYRIFAIPRI